MEKQDIEDLIEKKILEAKLIQAEANELLAEKRLHFALWFGGAVLALFGVIVPLWPTNSATEKVDKTIQEMEKRFSDMAGNQSRRPEIDCLFDGKNLENQVLTFFVVDDPTQILEIRNIGTATAQNVKIRFYVDSEKIINVNGWESVNPSTEKSYLKEFLSSYVSPPLDPKEVWNLGISIYSQGEELVAPALLKIFYGEPEPKSIPLTIKIRKK